VLRVLYPGPGTGTGPGLITASTTAAVAVDNDDNVCPSVSTDSHRSCPPLT